MSQVKRKVNNDQWLELRLVKVRGQLMSARGREPRAVVEALEREMHDLWVRLMSLVPKQ